MARFGMDSGPAAPRRGRAPGRPLSAATGRALACAALAMAALLAGCERAPRYTPIPPDSTAAARVDSLVVDIRRAQQQWEQGEVEPAAALTASLLRDDLARRPDRPREERARRFLDSLAVGFEMESDGDLIAVNLFSRSDPDAGARPYLLWGEPGALRHQAVEGQDLRLLDVARGAGGEAAVLYGRRARDGVQPLLMTWTRQESGPWSLAQTLGPDSLGGAGEAHFAAGPDDGVELVARTWRTPRHFDECGGCPHVVHERRFRWEPAGFTRVDERRIETPYTALVAFVEALANADRLAAERWVAEPALVDSADALGFGHAGPPWRVAPGTTERAREMTLYRGPHDAFQVAFDRRGEGWIIRSLSRTSRRIE